MAQNKSWTDLISLNDLEKEWVTSVSLGSRQFAVYDTPAGIYVSLAFCTHGGANLCDGYFDGHIIECPLHQGYFDVRNGKALGAPATKPLRTFEVRIEKGIVQILVSHRT